jgi:hypothetical protein
MERTGRPDLRQSRVAKITNEAPLDLSSNRGLGQIREFVVRIPFLAFLAVSNFISMMSVW